MKTQIRLGSVVPNGIGGPEAGALDLIYSYLLSTKKQTFYKYITINEIDDRLKEFVRKEKAGVIHVNIRTSNHENYKKKNAAEKNEIRVEVIHEALMRIAKFDNKFNCLLLEEIREEIISNKFLFEIPIKQFKYRKDELITASIFVQPGIEKFEYFLKVEKGKEVKCKLLIYSGLTNTYYFDYFFKYCKWKGPSELNLYGSSKQVEINIQIDSCSLQLVNLSDYEKPPLFEIFRLDISEDERELAKRNWISSLSPAAREAIEAANNVIGKSTNK